MTTILSIFESLVNLLNSFWNFSPIGFVLTFIGLLVISFVFYAEMREHSENPGLHPKDHRRDAEDWVKSIPWFNKIN